MFLTRAVYKTALINFFISFKIAVYVLKYKVYG